MAAVPPPCDFGWIAPDFALPSVQGQTLRYADIAGPRGCVVAFICNHCPYVVAIARRLPSHVQELRALGVGFVAINANDARRYPQDSFENMGKFARQFGFDFPYLYDETQSAARAYGAVCTPDFFGFAADRGLQYRGRLDLSRQDPGPDDAERELVEAMHLIAETGRGPKKQNPSMGCSIKWKEV